MSEVVIVDAVRSPVGRRNGGLSTVHPADLLGAVLTGLVERTGIDPSAVGQMVTGCVSQVGEQSFNVGRTAWLSAGLPETVATTTVDTQCGSSQQATGLAAAMIAAGVIDVAIASGVESMSRIPIGSNSKKELGLGRAVPKSYFSRFEFTSQFEGAERIADKWGISREDADRFGLASQQKAAQAWAEGRFDGQIVPIEAPVLDESGAPTGETRTVTRDEGLRDTSLEALASLKPVARPDGVHTAGSSSQISDGAGAVLMMTAERASQLGLTPKARIVETCLVGVDPVLMLTGPIDASARLLQRSGWSMDDIDVAEINEAFASVVLAWEKETGPRPAAVNPNGGAIALGHPLGGTGVILLTKALYELERTGGHKGLVSMCCGGGLGTGTLIER
ncbi:steroid 3-ketoacyl-CoA thiolase [Acidiferrimicrobium sp. IK]|uniref:steroid 3-ketoacyl-CoA thiolase n=1 Tax=Acidiferrimicrobium sp. IK TaxID=2871700 RepID=UPI0021CAF58A|nr:steroid 3-ketoacyl-CoA thiolase [Acidiferrimicrobium sp. IK]MCU4184228.1 steroid 3-ketoacyl-CoA thiolase [Acidiferrimicrobium sp. IK]